MILVIVIKSIVKRKLMKVIRSEMFFLNHKRINRSIVINILFYCEMVCESKFDTGHLLVEVSEKKEEEGSA